MIPSIDGIARRAVALLLAAMFVTATATVQADPVQPKQEPPKTVKLVLYPAAQPRPALRYRLLPRATDLEPGNAAVIYNKIAIQITEPHVAGMIKDLEDLLYGQAEDFDYEKAAKLLDGLRVVFVDLRYASTRSQCDWELPIRQGENVFAILLPELQKTRTMARLLAIKARVEIHDGRYHEAVATLRNGYALARHVAQGPTLVNALVGIAIARIMSDEAQVLVQRPDAPNLYWALAELPRPLIDLAPALATESELLFFLVPELKEIDDAQHGPGYWEHLLEKLAGKWGEVEGSKQSWKVRLAMTALALKGYPLARQGLIDVGYSAERVDAMPVPQVVLLYTVQTYCELRDDMFKWLALPYPQAREGLLRAERAIRQARHREILPVASLLLPAVAATGLASAQSERSIAVLQTLEALRTYAADHEGQLPERLADVTEAPVPANSITGQPFVYRKEGGRAVLDVLGPPDDLSNRHALRFEIEMRPRPVEKDTEGSTRVPATSPIERRAS